VLKRKRLLRPGKEMERADHQHPRSSELQCECGGSVAFGVECGKPTGLRPRYYCETDDCGAVWTRKEIDKALAERDGKDKRTKACHHQAKTECQYCEKETPPKAAPDWSVGQATKEDVRVWVTLPQQGWQCPQCDTIYAPFVTHCSECKPRRNYEVFGPYARFTETQFKTTTTMDPPSNS